MSESPTARFMIVSASFIIIIAGMKSAEVILVPFLLSLFIAVICYPPLSWLKSKGVPAALALCLIVTLVATITLLFWTVVGSSINNFRGDLPEYKERLLEVSMQGKQFLDAKGIVVSSDIWFDVFDPSIALSFAGTMMSSLGNVMTNALLIFLTVIFILAEEVRFSDKVKLSAGGNSLKGVEAVDRFVVSINKYMAIKAALSLLTGVLIISWLMFLGVDYPIMWGMFAFMLNFVPNLGSIIAAVPAVLLALIQLGVGDALYTGLGYVVVNMLIGNVLEPRMMGKGLDLSTLVVFLSLVFWGWVLGPVGMLLSVPLTMTLKIALESFDDTRWVAVFLGSGK